MTPTSEFAFFFFQRGPATPAKTTSVSHTTGFCHHTNSSVTTQIAEARSTLPNQYRFGAIPNNYTSMELKLCFKYIRSVLTHAPYPYPCTSTMIKIGSHALSFFPFAGTPTYVSTGVGERIYSSGVQEHVLSYEAHDVYL